MAKVTIKDIAERAGVSKTTVSFALNAPERISRETYARIMAIVEELGYVPNPFARSLTTKRLGALGVLLPQPIGEVFDNPHLSQVISGIGEECERRELSLAMLPLIKGKILEAARKAYVDGLITIGVGPDHEVVALLERNHIPFVTIDGEESSQTINIGIDHEKAAYDLMQHVVSLGRRRIAIFALAPDIKPHEENRRSIVVEKRLEGFWQALAPYNLELERDVRIMGCPSSIQAGMQTARMLFSSYDRPDAIVAMSDIAAIGVILAAREAGLRIPEDVAIAGFDGIPESMLIEPALTTIAQPGREKGEEAARVVLEMLDGKPGRHVRLPYTLQIRASTLRTI
ncbi:MAG: LacI family DNA-binding transcriptional regulator [Rectinemataceae bacterium]|nr:LacI family transcriptional regulator [Spirochaetaceae bacterium]